MWSEFAALYSCVCVGVLHVFGICSLCQFFDGFSLRLISVSAAFFSYMFYVFMFVFLHHSGTVNAAFQYRYLI